MILPQPRAGEEVKILQRPTQFSYWPAGEGKRREKLQSTLFASDPWFLIRSVLASINNSAASTQAYAFNDQARDFYSAAMHSDITAAKPLLLYYSFLNLAKCYIVKQTNSPLVGRISHGLSEKLPTTVGAVHGEVSIAVNDPGSAYAKFARSLGEQLPAAVAPATTVKSRSQDFLAQILIGHRVFCQGEGIKERFVSIEEVEYRFDQATRMLWLRLRLFHDDLQRLGYSQKLLVSSLTRAGAWRNVACVELKDGRRLIEAEQIQQTPYQHWPLSKLNELSATIRPALWRSVTAYPPYRKYYLYFATSSQLLTHQLLSIYLATYYFSSITRYKPESWNGILESNLGPFVNEFFSNQPLQFLYLMASEFIGQEVTKAAIAH